MTEEQEQIGQAVYRATVALNQAIEDAHDNGLRVRIEVHTARNLGAPDSVIVTPDVVFPVHSRA